MTLFRAYIRQHRKGIFAFALFCAVFCFSFFLYRLPLKAVLYPAGLCAAFGLVFSGTDFVRQARRYKKLSESSKLPAAMLPDLPPAEGLEAAAYRELVRALREELAALNTSAAKRYRDLTEYYTVWVHQIKTPITSMRLSLEKEDTALSRKLSSDLFQIERYVEMVLAYLRLDASTSDYVFREYALDEMIQQSITKFASEFIARRIHLNYTPTDKTVVTDDKWLSFVIEQLLSNALKYTREGEIRIYLREPKTLCIEDTGIGIAPSDLPRVFEKGYTGYNGRTDKRASGIGLYLCRRVCEGLGIDIRIISELDKGTTVLLNLEQYKLKNE